jgi:hypothetical protein
LRFSTRLKCLIFCESFRVNDIMHVEHEFMIIGHQINLKARAKTVNNASSQVLMKSYCADAFYILCKLTLFASALEWRVGEKCFNYERELFFSLQSTFRKIFCLQICLSWIQFCNFVVQVCK